MARVFDNPFPDAPPLFPAEKRQSPRHATEAPAIMRVRERPGPFLVTILDVSVAGVRLSSPTYFRPGTKATLKWHGVEVGGEIRYARPVENGYNLGFLVENPPGGEELDLVKLLRPNN